MHLIPIIVNRGFFYFCRHFFLCFFFFRFFVLFCFVRCCCTDCCVLKILFLDVDWDVVEALWECAFKTMRVDPREHPVLHAGFFFFFFFFL